MKYISVCSGIEAATVAWHPLGWEPLAFSEIEKFPSAVLQYHWPDIPNHGDFTTMKGDEYGRPDILVGGTPCQSFSIAGLRGGLDDERGNLALEYLRLAKRTGAKWLVWENVPGVLSSNEGRDFGTFLGGLVELGYRFAYRVLDAQYIRVESHSRAVPQRRRRVFVVGYLGDWRPPAAVLFEQESLSRYPAPSREKGESVAALTANGVGTCGADDNQGQAGHIVVSSFDASYGKLQGCSGQDMNHGHSGLVVLPIHDKATRHKGGGVRQEDGVEHNDGAANGLGIGGDNDPCYTITSGDKHGVAYSIMPMNSGKDYRARETDISQPITTCGHFQGNQGGDLIMQSQMMVRRLTPLECCRLQGFPDHHARIPWRGKPAEKCPDGPMYKAYGNSMSINCMSWLGQRIDTVEDILNEAKK
jgi:DNA (cytosine-5)-methyltransferase 1